MARVTVEDCVEKVENRFELVAIAAQRAKAIASGAAITINRDKDKDSVIALREIAQETITVESLKEQVTQNFQKPLGIEEEEFEIAETEASASDDSEDEAEAAPAAPDEISELMDEETEALLPKEMGEEPEGISFEEDNLDVDD